MTASAPDAFLAKMARFTVPGDDTEDMRERVARVAAECGVAASEVEAEDVASCSSDDFLVSEVIAFWSMVHEARDLLAGKVAS